MATSRRAMASLPAAVGGRGAQAARIAGLARQLAELGPEPSPAIADRIATQLRRLSTVMGAEPFRQGAAGDIGADLFVSGLFGDANTPMHEVERTIRSVLAMLRAAGPGTFGVSGSAGEHRLTAVIDEISAAFARTAVELPRHPRAVRAPEPLALVLNGAVDVDDWAYRAAFEQAEFAVALVALDGGSMVGNGAMRRMLGLTDPDEEARPLADFLYPDDLLEAMRFRQRVSADGAPAVHADVRLVRSGGEIVWVHMMGSLLRDPDGMPSYIMTRVDEIADWPQRTSWSQAAAPQDLRARLPGRAQAEQWLHQAFHGGAREVAVCALVIDSFDMVSDRHGGPKTERLLTVVAGRLQVTAGQHVLTRTGAGEFHVLMADPPCATAAVELGDRLLDALSAPFALDGGSLTLSASVGVAQSSTTDSSAAELIRSADVAASWAASLGGGRRMVYDHERDAGEAARYSLLTGLHGAIGRNEFRLLYQPLVGLRTGALVGAEALVRWQHPDQGLIGPARFIPLAEQSGAIVPLGRWVLEQACVQAAEWAAVIGAAAPYVSVNVSPIQMAAPGWVDEVGDVLATTGLPADRLQLEVTEQAVLGDEVAAMTSLSALADAGVRLALDDFGTGYSSFAWLRRLPVHTLKIDGSFVDGLRHPDPDRVDTSIVRALVDMAHALELEVTAEWVETPFQAQRLTELGCDVGQGRWFGDPGPGEWVPEDVRRRMGH